MDCPILLRMSDESRRILDPPTPSDRTFHTVLACAEYLIKAGHPDAGVLLVKRVQAVQAEHKARRAR